MSKFRYDVECLIENVEIRPCLWDKCSDDYKDKVKKKNAWKEICRYFEPNFDTMDPRDQEKLANIVTGKWQNVRDAFTRSLKKKSGQAPQHKYIYYEQMKFVLKIDQKDETASSIAFTKTEDRDEDDVDRNCVKIEVWDDDDVDRNCTIEDYPASPEGSSQSFQIQKNPRKRQFGDTSDDGIARDVLKRIREDLTPPDEDESFFNSVTPSVRRMTEDEKIEFRVGVLRLIQKIKHQRQLAATTVK